MGKFLLGLMLGLLFVEILYRVRLYRLTRETKKLMFPSRLNHKKLCKGSHIWMETEILGDEGYTKTNLCRVCGFLSGTELMVSQDAIDRIEEEHKLTELENTLYKEFSIQEEAQVKKHFENELTQGVSWEKLAQLHTAGITFRTRYGMYKASKAPEMEEELTRSNA